MVSGLRGLAQSFVRGAVRLGMKAEEIYYGLRDVGLEYLRPQVYQDYEKFERQDFIYHELQAYDRDYLIPGHLHEESVWQLSRKYRYEVSTPWETEEGELITKHTTITSDERLTMNEVFEAAEDHPSMYAPEEGVFRGEMEVVGVWSRG